MAAAQYRLGSEETAEHAKSAEKPFSAISALSAVPSQLARYTDAMTVSVAAPPGPKLSLMASLLYRPGLGNPLEFFSDVARTYGDIASYRIAGEQLFFVNDPQLIKDILVTHQKNFTKSRGLERTKRLLGNGLLTSEGAMHLRQRRLLQ